MLFSLKLSFQGHSTQFIYISIMMDNLQGDLLWSRLYGASYYKGSKLCF